MLDVALEDHALLRERHVLPLPAPMYAKPVTIVKGRGQYVWDDKGKKYLDAFAGVATVSIGHSHPHWLGAIKAQMEEYYHTPALYLHPSLGKVAKRLVDSCKAANPELDMCFFTNSGSEANDLAALIAKNYTGCHDFVALRHAYHGRTLMTMALTGQQNWRHTLPYGQSVAFAKHDDAEDLRQVIRTATSGKIAAFYAEPINGVGGVMVPSKDYFPAAYDIVKKANGLFVADEVQTGVYRTGPKFLGIENWGVKPDIVTMAKGLGNGYPVGAVITTRAIGEAMRGKLHYNTFGGGPVQMAAVNATLDVLEKERLGENAKTVGSYLMSKLPGARGMGLMIGVPVETADLAVKIVERMKDSGVLVGKGGLDGNVVRIKPPLCITKEDADTIAAAFKDACASKN